MGYSTAHQVQAVEIDGRTLGTTTKESQLTLAWGPIGLGWQWARPAHLDVVEADGSSRRVVIRDHLLEVRVSVLVILALLLLRRRH